MLHVFRKVTPIILCLLLIAGCSPFSGADDQVEGAGPEELLKLRAGPGLGFRVILGLPDGTNLVRRDCITENSQIWCEVTLADAPKISGFVSADYLAKF